MLPWRLLLFAAILLGTLFFVYLGMIFGYEPYLNSQIKNLDQKIAGLNQRVESDETKNLINLYSQLVNIQGLLRSHPLPSKLFQFLENNMDAGVYYSDLNLSLSDRNLKIAGAANDYGALARQLEIFRKSPSVKAVFLDESKTGEANKIIFTMKMIMDENILR